MSEESTHAQILFGNIIVDVTHGSDCGDCNTLANHVRKMMVAEQEDSWMSDLNGCSAHGLVMGL